MEILHCVAHEISSRPDRADPPADSAEAKAGLDALLDQLQRETPRFGLSARTARFVDHVAGVAARYGTYIFTCFDFPLVPPDTNDIERYFGATKGQLRRALGTASTAGSVAKNLGADYVDGFATAWLMPGDSLLESLAPGSDTDYDRARREVREAEQKATLRRSRRRAPARHVDAILADWLAAP